MKLIFRLSALAFFSFLLLSSGVVLHGVKPQAPAPAASGKPAAHAVHGKSTVSVKTAPHAAVPGAAPDNPQAFPLLFAGALGLLISSLSALALCRSLYLIAPDTARRLRETEQAARKKQQEEFDARQEALQSQLLEARQRKAETETLRDQVSRQFQEFFRTLPVPCFCFAADGRIIRWNAACETLYGIPAAAALDLTLWETLVPPSEREDAEAKIARVLAGESLLGSERRDMVAGGALLRLRCSMVPLYDPDGQIVGGLSAGVDMTEFGAMEQQIAALTAALEAARAASKAAPETDKGEPGHSAVGTREEGIPELSGHAAFRARLQQEIDRAARYHAPLSLVLLDLDGFGARNRTLGFEAGDLALEAAVAVIKSKIRTVDIIARLGADEYAVILPETGEAGARVAADRLRAGIAGTTPAGQPPLSACFGAALLTPDIAEAAGLVVRAQEALASAQSSGASSITHYQDLAGTPVRAA